MANIIIPTPLRKFTNNQASVESNGATVQQSVEDLAKQFPDLNKHIFDAEGKIRQFIRIYVGDEDINALENENTKVDGSSVISIIPAIAGGIQ
ncbi:molybdopterin synthase subunit MoaD [Reichenbachiella faecimaris]|uniref:Molybdopterin synthase subunit MoaD n=1 Tax=Reichenbachiella faecimaris TaxID=692418 RepID=A0A1W2GQZ7_REIFA|nr:MoaD/ThiS family protein [Reichenbachiella faecimaris]SMD39069.1 molybdopterin synthase subunit MoaD [Reichenbachiella faecimaris]